MLHNPKLTGEEIGVVESQFVTPIPYSKHSINEADIEAVLGCLRYGPITQGNIVTNFENYISKRVGSVGTVASNSATSSLHLACLALDIGPGDVVWTAPVSFVASANTPLMCGAEVDFVDVELDTGNLCITSLEQKIKLAKAKNKLPKALIVVHFSGRPCRMLEIYNICNEHGIKIIEDAAHALGSNQGQHPTGFCDNSDITVFSLHPAKIITSAEGGLATSQNKNLLDRMKLLSSHGISRFIDANEPWKYDMVELGFNYRMSELHAALGTSQLKRIDRFIEKRKKIVSYYLDKIGNLPLKCPPYSSESAWHLFVCQTEDEKTRRDLYRFLYEKNIHAAIHYRPIYQNSYFQKLGFNSAEFPKAEGFYSRSISLPLYTEIKETQLKYVVKKLHEFYGVKYD